MNRKIFTLLAGAFLLLATVFSASAQPSAITNMGLRVGQPVDKLKAGANDYYHLVVTGVNGPTNLNLGNLVDPAAPTFQKWVFDDLFVALGGTAPYWNSNLAGGAQIKPLVLYMGNKVGIDYPIFVAPLGDVHSSAYWTSSVSWFPATAPKTMESASSLWCTVVNPYDQGQNATFDFTNKHNKNQMLEAEIADYEIWGPVTSGFGKYDIDNYQSTKTTDIWSPGVISGWNFSEKYATTVDEVRPLYSYITADTVAVLCTDIFEILNYIDGAANIPDGVRARMEVGAHVVVKIASIDDVLNDDVPGMLYFTLHEAAPFVLDANDFNTLFASKPDSRATSLKFEPNADPADTNPFTYPAMSSSTNTGALYAEHILPGDYTGNIIYTRLSNPIGPTGGTTNFDADGYPVDGGFTTVYNAPFALGAPATNFDEMGYMYLKKTSTATVGGSREDYLYVKHDYYDDNKGGDQFLNFGFRRLNPSVAYVAGSDTAKLYDALYPQSIWRLVYYPTGDSIYINPYQATYLPTHSGTLMTRSTTSSSDGGVKLDWLDDLTQSSSYYTFRAAYSNLELPASPDMYDVMTARLKYGKQAGYALTGPAFYSYYHRNYVTIQNLTGSVKIVTLGNGNFEANHKIDTWIHGGDYEKCSEGATADRLSVPTDLYVIRSNDGKYFLRVPLHSAVDSAEWWMPEPDERPWLMPSYQWAVIKRHENNDQSQISLINREFDGTVYEFIQLSTAKDKPFNISGKTYNWNTKPINGLTTTVADHKGNTNSFIAVSKTDKSNKYLGYEYVSRDMAMINVYSLNFAHEYDHTRFVSWKGDYWKYPNTDTTVFVLGQAFDRIYFKLDTSSNYTLEKYGFDPKDGPYKGRIADLVPLERQPYYLNFEDPYKLLCRNLFTLMNGTQNEYSISDRRKVEASYLGTPVFNLRHTYFKTNDKGETVPYFALVQRLNKTDYISSPTDRANFKTWISQHFTPTIATTVDNQIERTNMKAHTRNDYWRTGVFVAGVDNQTAKLKFMIRADEATTVSTFALVQDDDPIYRRFNSVALDGAEPGNEDAPKQLSFYWMDRPSYEMFENTGYYAGQKAYWENYGIGTVKTEGKKNYLGYVNINQYTDAATSIYVDTAFINRGTGPVKPQYLLVVDPQWPDKDVVCDEEGNFIDVYENYLRGRFLINATDSARGVAESATKNAVNQNSINAAESGLYKPYGPDKFDNPIGKSYLWENNWERLVFTDAIHSYEYDALYLIAGVNLAPFMYEGNSGVVDIKKLDAASDTTALSTTKYIRKIKLGNNFHKDAVFQMRLIERNAVEFIMESETGTPEGITASGISTNPLINNNRKWGNSFGQLNSYGPMIAPCAGGWVKEQNGTAVISRSNIIDNLGNALKLNTHPNEAWPTGNESVAAVAPTVIGGNNAITILGAAGKKVVVTNVLGQTVAGAVLTSDNATIPAPKGIVVVTIDGKAAVKTLVK